jgi:hypothetical protein
MKHTSPLLLAALAVTALLVGIVHGPAVAILAFAIGSALIVTKPIPGQCNATTLTSTEILMDVIDAFAKKLPFLRHIGADWRTEALKKDGNYIAHVASIPATEAITNANYANMTGQTARSLLTDVPVTTNKHIGCKLKWAHLNSIQDRKNEYEKAIAYAGYSMAKSVIDDIITGFTPNNFSASSHFAVADADADMLDHVTGDLNLQGAAPAGRYMLVNTPVANVMAGDSRLTSADYAGQRVRGEGYRRWAAVNGFEEIMEYPDLANTTSGTALTGVAGTASTDVLTKADHNLATGQQITITFASGFTGLTSGTTYYVIRVDSSTFKVATTAANALAGTAIDITADGTGATVTPTQNLLAFAGDLRAVALLGGIPAGIETEVPAGLSVTRVMNVEAVTHPDLGISMAAISWQEAGTGDIYWVPTLVYGLSLGKAGAANAPGATLDNAGHRIVLA